MVINDEPRFAPAYVGRVSRALHNTEPLDAESLARPKR